ncbi:uncharacterized protein BDW70DRAFT_84665 [Aspergillus foveolatus]|uniref:uncharacterized protein n=1 Tax=Aspergillus foveolatus TaxID=210207 RepID=UPI003CCDF08B
MGRFPRCLAFMEWAPETLAFRALALTGHSPVPSDYWTIVADWRFLFASSSFPHCAPGRAWSTPGCFLRISGRDIKGYPVSAGGENVDRLVFAFPSTILPRRRPISLFIC